MRIICQNIIIFTFLLVCFKPLFANQKEQDSLLTKQLKDAVKNMESGSFDISLQQFEQIEKQALKENNYKILTTTILNKGNIYYVLSENEKALNLYFNAADLAIQYEINDVLNSIYNNIAIIYSKNNNAEKAKEFFTKAMKISLKLDDEFKVGINLLNLANLEDDNGNYNDALSYVDSAEKIFNGANDQKKLAGLYSIKGNIYKNQEKFLLAKNNQLKAYSIEKKLGDPTYLASYSLYLGETYQTLGSNDSALFYLNECISIAKEINNKEILIDAMLVVGKIHKIKGDLNRAIEYYNNSLVWKDSLLAEKSQKWVSEMQMKYDFNKKVQEIDFLNRRNKLHLIILIISLFSVLIISILIIYSLRSRNVKIRQKNELLKNEKILHELEIQKSEAENKCLLEEMKSNEEISLVKQEKLQEQIEYKNRELASNALHVVNKNNILVDIQTLLKTLDLTNEKNTLAKISSILRLINSNINLDNDWNDFKIHFEKVHGDFFSKISTDFPSLTQGDLRLCAYLLINLNSKEISQILNISPDSIRKRKQRLREKLNLEKESELLNTLNKYKS